VSIVEVREGLETLLASVPGIASASGFGTEKIGALPAAYVGFDTDQITAGASEVDLHSLPIIVLVARKAMLPNEVRLMESLIEPLKDAIRADQDLGTQTVCRVQFREVLEGVFKFADVDYTGFTMTLEIKEISHVSYG